PVDYVESCTPAAKIGPYLDKMRTKFLDRDSQNMFVLKNGLYSPNLLVGNSLLFLTVPRSAVARSTGMQIRDYYHAEESRQMDLLSRINLRDEFIEAGRARIGGIASTPDVFVANNYGDVSAHDGSEIHASRGTLTKYQWHMPITVMRLGAGERSGFFFTITIRDKAFNFETVRRVSHQDGIATEVIENSRAEPVS
ncbi:hypothetical protein, partial [Nocardia salmonicida]